MIQIHFRNAENQRRWAWTEGLQALGQQEMAVLLSWPEDAARDTLVIAALRFLEQYITHQPKHILPGQTLRYGWTMLRFVADEQHLSGAGKDVLLIEEKQYPFVIDDPSYCAGLTHTTTLIQLQHAALRRNRISGDAEYPSPAKLAIICNRIKPETITSLRPLMAHRFQQPDAKTSGWFFGCCDHDHDHDDSEQLASIHLHHLVKRFPGLFPYLAMPVGYQLLFEETRAVVFHPGVEHGQVDPENLLSVLPC